MHRGLLGILSLLAIILGIAPLVLALAFEVLLPLYVVIPLSFIGWVVAALLLSSRKEMVGRVDETMQHLGFQHVSGTLEKKLTYFLEQSARYHRVAYAHSLKGITRKELGLSLQKIVQLTYVELDAQSVELALFDKNSGLWSQALIAGFPKSVPSQSMLTEASNPENRPVSETDETAPEVLTQELTFAGTLFGSLRVEYREGRRSTVEDRQVLSLLATQSSVLLVDSQFTDELLRMRRVSEESIQAKTGFLANLSHEIRGPLGVVINGVELVQDGLCGPITESQRETLQMIKDSSDHLLELVNDVLDYARVEAGKVNAKPVEIGVKQLLDTLATLVRSQVLAKQHKMTVEKIDSKLGLVCDRRHVRQMLINFLTNAIKYTPTEGKISVGAERIPGGKVKIFVKDSGIGIPESEHSKVFGAFERVDNQYANAQVGTGLGMPLTRKLAEVNGGTADFTSAEGEGSTFWLVMDAVEIEEVEPVEEGEKKGKSEPKGRGESILLVDHDDDTRTMLERYLVHQGFRILNASSGKDVLKMLREEEINLAVVENDMPDLSGEDMVAAIRANPKAATVPIILLSAKAFVFDIERFLKLGVDRCLSKPVELNELASTARQLIDESVSLKGDSK